MVEKNLGSFVDLNGAVSKALEEKRNNDARKRVKKKQEYEASKRNKTEKKPEGLTIEDLEKHIQKTIKSEGFDVKMGLLYKQVLELKLKYLVVEDTTENEQLKQLLSSLGDADKEFNESLNVTEPSEPTNDNTDVMDLNININDSKQSVNVLNKSDNDNKKKKDIPAVLIL